MALFLIITAAVIFACIIFNRVSAKLGIPMLLAFIVLGILFGSDGIVKIPFDNYVIAEQVCSVALIFIIFYGGFGTKWSASSPSGANPRLPSASSAFSTQGMVSSVKFSVRTCFPHIRQSPTSYHPRS